MFDLNLVPKSLKPQPLNRIRWQHHPNWDRKSLLQHGRVTSAQKWRKRSSFSKYSFFDIILKTSQSSRALLTCPICHFTNSKCTSFWNDCKNKIKGYVVLLSTSHHCSWIPPWRGVVIAPPAGRSPQGKPKTSSRYFSLDGADVYNCFFFFSFKRKASANRFDFLCFDVSVWYSQPSGLSRSPRVTVDWTHNLRSGYQPSTAPARTLPGRPAAIIAPFILWSFPSCPFLPRLRPGPGRAYE